MSDDSSPFSERNFQWYSTARLEPTVWKCATLIWRCLKMYVVFVSCIPHLICLNHYHYSCNFVYYPGNYVRMVSNEIRWSHDVTSQSVNPMITWFTMSLSQLKTNCFLLRQLVNFRKIASQCERQVGFSSLLWHSLRSVFMKSRYNLDPHNILWRLSQFARISIDGRLLVETCLSDD